jgi:predicted PurR-regulated permease PerM
VFEPLLAILVLLLLLYVLRPIYPALAVALVIFYLLHPVEWRLEARLKRKWLAMLLTCLFVLLPGVVFFSFVIYRVAVEAASLLSTPEARQALAVAGINAQQYATLLQLEVAKLAELSIEDLQKLLTSVKGYESLLQAVVGGLFAFFKALGGAFFQLFLGIVLALYLLTKAEEIASFAESFADRRVVAYFSYLDALLRQIVYSIFLTALFTGLLSYGVYYTFALPFAGLLAALTGVLTLIPIVGGWLVYAPMSGYLYLAYGTTKAAFFFVTCVAVLSVLPDIVIRPVVAGIAGRVPVVPLLIGFIAGTASLGAKGILLGPIIIFAALGFVRIFVRGED